MADWAGLPYDLLYDIGERVTSIESYDSFGAVCRSWQATTTKDKEYLERKTFEAPWLMFGEGESGMREFFSFSMGKTRTIFLPEASRKRCLSWKDWLFIIEEDLINASLFHLVSRIQLRLPELDTIPDYDYDSFKKNIYFPKKVVLSANPSSTSDFIIMVKWSIGTMSFCKLGDTSWTEMENWRWILSNLMSYGDKLYTLDDGNGPTPILQTFDIWLWEKIVYMVELSKKLLLISRNEDYQKLRYKIYEVDIENDERVEINNFGNKALFLHCKYSFFVECSKFNKCKPNCIYFIRDGIHRDDMVYHLLDGRIEPFVDENLLVPLYIEPSF